MNLAEEVQATVSIDSDFYSDIIAEYSDTELQFLMEGKENDIDSTTTPFSKCSGKFISCSGSRRSIRCNCNSICSNRGSNSLIRSSNVTEPKTPATTTASAVEEALTSAATEAEATVTSVATGFRTQDKS